MTKQELVIAVNISAVNVTWACNEYRMKLVPNCAKSDAIHVQHDQDRLLFVGCSSTLR